MHRILSQVGDALRHELSNLSSYQLLIRLMRLTGGVIWLLETMYPSPGLSEKLSELRALKPGTVGRGVAELLDKKGYRLIPKFENHDLKHLVLGYEMTMPDEIRMQAFLVGNGNHTAPCLLFLALGLFYPAIWKDLPTAYKQGKKAKPIYFLTLDACLSKSLTDIQQEYRRDRNRVNLAL